jgi:cell wall-associated NlpC family hydrolase
MCRSVRWARLALMGWRTKRGHMDFDHLLHSLITARAPGKSRRWWRRPTTIGAAAIVALSATAAGAVSSNQSPVALTHPLAKTYAASAWPDLVQPSPPAVAPAPASSTTAAAAPAGPVVGAVNLCSGADENPGAALTAMQKSSTGANATPIVLTDATVSPGSTSLNSLLPTITGAVAGAANALGLPLPALPSIPLPTNTIPSTLPSTLPSSSGGGVTGAGGSTSAQSAPTTTTTTTPPASPPPPTNATPLSPAQLGDPSVGSNDSNIGCDLIGSGTVGGMAPGETAAESSAVTNAIALLGIPYQWGGESTQGGFDCSGMVQYVYREVGVFLPRVAQDQYDAGPAVPPGGTVEPGDLVFFGDGVNDVSHVGMYVGDGLMIDAPHTGAVVRFDRVAGFEPIVGVTSPGQGQG